MIEYFKNIVKYNKSINENKSKILYMKIKIIEK